MLNLLAFARLATTTSTQDLKILEKGKMNALNEYHKAQQQKGKDMNNSNDPEVKKGVENCVREYLAKNCIMSKHNELAAWMYIKETAQKALEKYPNTL